MYICMYVCLYIYIYILIVQCHDLARFEACLFAACRPHGACTTSVWLLHEKEHNRHPYYCRHVNGSLHGPADPVKFVNTLGVPF
jgi:hypothetical protein